MSALLANETAFWFWLREAFMAQFYDVDYPDCNEQLEYELCQPISDRLFPAMFVKE